MVATAPAVTVTVAVAARVPLVTTTVLANVPDVVPAVKRPLLSIVPPPASTDHNGDGTATTLLFASLPVTVNCFVAFTTTDAGAGVIAMVASAPGTTVTDAVPVIVPLVAVTVLVNV